MGGKTEPWSLVGQRQPAVSLPPAACLCVSVCIYVATICLITQGQKGVRTGVFALLFGLLDFPRPPVAVSLNCWLCGKHFKLIKLNLSSGATALRSHSFNPPAIPQVYGKYLMPHNCSCCCCCSLINSCVECGRGPGQRVCDSTTTRRETLKHLNAKKLCSNLCRLGQKEFSA